MNCEHFAYCDLLIRRYDAKKYCHFMILLTIVICSTYFLHICSVQANGDENTPTFELNLEPTDPTTWEDWRPEYKTNTSFVATLKGTIASICFIWFGDL